MSGAPAGDLDFGVIRILGGDCDGNILDLRDRATNHLLGRRRTEEFYPLGCLQPSKFLRRKLYVCTAFPTCLGAPAGDLDGLMNPLASTSLITCLLIPV